MGRGEPTHRQMRAWERRRTRGLEGRDVVGICGILRRSRFTCLREWRDEEGHRWASVSSRVGGPCVGVFPSWKLRTAGR